MRRSPEPGKLHKAIFSNAFTERNFGSTLMYLGIFVALLKYLLIVGQAFILNTKVLKLNSGILLVSSGLVMALLSLLTSSLRMYASHPSSWV